MEVTHQAMQEAVLEVLLRAYGDILANLVGLHLRKISVVQVIRRN